MFRWVACYLRKQQLTMHTLDYIIILHTYGCLYPFNDCIYDVRISMYITLVDLAVLIQVLILQL